MGGGSVLAIGVYAIQICQWVYRNAPTSIFATGTLNENGVDLEVSAELSYSVDKVGKMKFSALNTLNNKAIIVGTNGQITVYITDMTR